MNESKGEANAFVGIRQPSRIQTPLYDYQKVSARQLEEITLNKRIDNENGYILTDTAILGLNMRLGKTLISLAVIARQAMPWDLHLPYLKNRYFNTNEFGNFVEISQQRYQRLNCSLVITSLSIADQWISEIHRHTSLRVLLLDRNDKITTARWNEYDLIITTSTMADSVYASTRGYAFRYLFYDEPDSVIIARMPEIVAGFTILVTGTYSVIPNNRDTSYFTRLFRNKDIERFVVKAPLELINRRVNFEDTIDHYYRIEDKSMALVLANYVNDRLKEMIHAGDVRGVTRQLQGASIAKDLPSLIRNSIIKKIDDLRERIIDAKIDEVKHKLQHEVSILSNRLNDLDRDMHNYVNAVECLICQEKPNQPMLVNCCQTIYCSECFLQWYKDKNTCPHCRAPLDKDSYATISFEEDVEEKKVAAELPHYNGHLIEASFKTKIEALTNLIKKLISQDRQILLYSSHNKSFDILGPFLQQMEIGYYQLKGTHQSRSHMIDAFNKKVIKILFINAREDCAGLTIPATDDVIFYHRLENLQFEKQAIMRAFHIEMKKQIHVHYFLE